MRNLITYVSACGGFVVLCVAGLNGDVEWMAGGFVAFLGGCAFNNPYEG
jgi:hypothetical protein